MDKQIEQFENILARPGNQIILPIALVSIFTALMLWTNPAFQYAEEEYRPQTETEASTTIVPRQETVENLVGSEDKDVKIKPAMAGLPV